MGDRRGTEKGREVELKLAFDPADRDRVAEALARRAGKRPKPARLDSVYYDTPAFALAKARVTLRVRRIGRRRIQTVKAGGGGAGLVDRPEWEGEIAGDGPDRAAARATGLAPLSRKSVLDKVGPVFATRVRRTAFGVSVGQSRIEAALDEGTIEAGARSEPVLELELELKRGDPADVFALAQELVAEMPLRPLLPTKAERGYALARGKNPKAVKAGTPELTPEMSVAEAFRAIGRSCLTQLLANEPLLRRERDPDAVHQMRVAMRRLRAAMSLFKAVAADGRSAAVKDGLRWLAGKLGAARDLDVFIAKTLGPARERHPDDAALAELAASSAGRRDAAYAAALAAVSSPRFGRVVLDAAAWIETGPWLSRPDTAAERARPVADFAAEELARRAKRIRKRAKRLETLEPEARHEVRIAVKKLRYAADFFSSLYAGKGRRRRLEAFRAALSDLQDRLGDLNDIAVAEAMASDADGAGAAARLIAGDQAAHFDESLAAASEAHRDFVAAEPFWDGAAQKSSRKRPLGSMQV